MYGRYIRTLAEEAEEEAKRAKEIDKLRRKEERQRAKELRAYRGRCLSWLDNLFGWFWQLLITKLGEDGIFLAVLGILVAVISFAQDYVVFQLNLARIYLYDLAHDPTSKYFAWISIPVLLVLFSSGFVHLVAPQAIGSGIPEMKTILRGVILKEYLSFRTFFAKCVGLTATLGAGMPLGKEGPLVHIASIVATLMSKLVTSLDGIYENESRKTEMLAAACAVGVSCCFGAPIGGVLYSIEVTSVFFAIRNYWRGFFSAVFGALTFRLLAYWYENHGTITAIFKTNFPHELPYDPQELVIYALIGVTCGLFGATFVFCHRRYVLFMRKSKRLNRFLQQNRFIYPFVISLAITSIYFPLGTGQFIASRLTSRQQVRSLFSNFTWGKDNLTVSEEMIVNEWRSDYSSIYFNLVTFIVTTFFLTIAASTLPVPSGCFITIFKMGAGYGRLVGELVALWFPEGIRVGSYVSQILPGGYSIVGAAAFPAGVTHSISICVVISEMTGQIKHLVPILVAVLASNVVARLLQPSLYESIIMIKKLPYLPDILPSRTQAYHVYVEDFMVRDVKYIWKGITFKELRDLLKEGVKIRAFPIVDSPNNMILLGSIQRWELLKVLDLHIGRERRLQVAAQWQEEARTRVRSELSYIFGNENGASLSPPPHYLSISPPPSPFTLSKPKSSVKTVGNNQNSNPEKSKHEENEITKADDDTSVRVRRLSRFEVIPAALDDMPSAAHTRVESPSDRPSLSGMASQAPSFDLRVLFGTPVPEADRASSPLAFSRGSSPRKSILKRTMSTSVPPGHSLPASLPITPYQTFTGDDYRARSPFETIFRRSNASLTSHDMKSFFPIKKVTLPKARVIDMSPEEQALWEEAEMEKPVDLTKCHIDPAPFQLVERTSLLKVHALFSMVGVNHAYVTAIGRLVGVVALPELRQAIENVNSGVLRPSEHKSPLEFNISDDDSSVGTDDSPSHAPETSKLISAQENTEEDGTKLTYEFDTATGEFNRSGNAKED
ncbi:chloride channel protein 2-like isoform X2 [Artemia franciscana]